MPLIRVTVGSSMSEPIGTEPRQRRSTPSPTRSVLGGQRPRMRRTPQPRPRPKGPHGETPSCARLPSKET